MKRRLRRTKKGRILPSSKPQKKALIPDIDITFDKSFNPYDFEVTEEIDELIRQYEHITVIHPRKAVRELRKIVKTLPHILPLRNYLVSGLKMSGRVIEAYELNNELLEEYPHYLYAVTTKVLEYLDSDNLDKIPSFLGGEPLSIQKTFPYRKQFYVMEVFNYYKVLLYYWATIGEVDMAEQAYLYLEQIQEGHPDLINLRLQVGEAGFKAALMRLDMQRK